MIMPSNGWFFTIRDLEANMAASIGTFVIGGSWVTLFPPFRS